MDVNANNIEATFDVETVELSSEFDIEQQNFDALFSINAAGTTWGSIDGNIENQADLIAILNSKATNEALTALATTVTNNYTTLDTKIDGVQSDLSGDISVLNTKVEGYNTALSNRIDTLSGTVSNNYTTLDGKITTINNTLSGYGNIVTHNVAEFATAAQGLLADTALQPNDNISELNNNVGYITGISSADVTNALGYTPYNATNPNGYITGINSTDVVTALGYTPYDSSNPDGYITSASLPTVNNNTITIQKNNTDVGSFTLNQSSNDTINITVPTDTQDLTNGAGFITSAALPTLSDLATNTQMAAIDSGATAEKIDQINTNTGDISNEIINRQLADNTLQSQIDAIVASSDVFDIVGTYAELQAYDISTVPVNDIIKVLVDSTHSDAATYYRCVENNNVKSWSYIGSEGAYYTKGEADSKFVEKTITINGQPLSSNITLTASDVNALPSSTTIGAGILTVQKNGTTIDTFGANDTGNTTINITVPTDTSDLTNNAGFITGITGTDVTNALGYTPYDSSNPSGYTSNIGTVTSVNNISPISGNITLSIPTATSDLTNDSGFITSSDLTNYVTTNTDQNITGTKTFVGQKKIGFKQSSNSDKLGFTLYTNNNTEKGYLEYNPSNTVDSVPLMTLGNYASSAAGLTHVGFRKYSSISGANGAYNLLTPLISDAKTPFNLTTTYTNFYLPLGFTDGTNTVKTAKSGLVDLSSILPTEVTETTVAGWGFTKNVGTVTSVNNTQPDANGDVTLSIPSISNLADKDLSNLSATGEVKFQAPLVSGTNIKTINNTSILGNGNITIDSLPSQTGQSGKFLTTNGTSASWVTVNADNVFIATYGTTTYQEVLTAYNAGKTIYAKRTINPISGINDYTYYALINYSDNHITDTFKFSNCTGKVIYTVTLADDNTWSIASNTLIANTDKATSSTLGIVQPDGSTITVNNGVISAVSDNNKADTDLSNITTVNTQITTTAINPLVNKLTNADITVAPSSDISSGISFTDTNDVTLVSFSEKRLVNGTQLAQMTAYNQISGTEKIAYINVYVDEYGNDYCYASDGVKSTIAGWGMPDYAQQIVGADGASVALTLIQCTKDSFVVIWAYDSYTEDYWIYVTDDTSVPYKYVVGRRYDDLNANTQGTSFTFLVPKGWYFTSGAEGGFGYRIFPLKGAN